MKKRYYSFIALTMILVLILATGCGVRINGKDYDLFTVSQKDKDSIFNVVGSESSSNQEISVEKQDGEELNVYSDAGNIKIKKSATPQIEIKAEKTVRGATDKDKKNILDNMNVELERDGKVINVVVKTKDGNDFWDWRKSNFNVFQVSINFHISLPDSINVIKVKTGAGNIGIDEVSSNLLLETGAGNINIQNVAALEENSLHTGVGNIDFKGNIDKISSFDASTGAGNVAIEVPENTKMSLKADTGIGTLSGSFIISNDNNKFHFVGDVNGGGPDVKLSTGVGIVKADAN
ncbi:MAG TPA: hypothetical protein VIK78_03625 [Ruminiclostridium sp.]